jgi:hypothetical protein
MEQPERKEQPEPERTEQPVPSFGPRGRWMGDGIWRGVKERG